jgi:hypothetical protein
MIKCVELKDDLAFHNIEVERVVYLLGVHVTSKGTKGSSCLYLPLLLKKSLH